MWIDWYRKYQPAEPECEVCWRVLKVLVCKTENQYFCYLPVSIIYPSLLEKQISILFVQYLTLYKNEILKEKKPNPIFKLFHLEKF